MQTIQIMRLSAETEDVPLPTYQTEGAAGLDICATVTRDVVLPRGDIVLIPTGFALVIPADYEVQIRPRSGLALHHGVTLINSPGTIDSDYRGEIKIPLINHGKKEFVIARGDRIAQMIVARIIRVQLEEVYSVERTMRGIQGFGHTGF